MSQHLPECHRWFADMPEDGCPACEMFSACEQRVLDAAREAVAALYASAGKHAQDMIDPDDALAAIDALREKP